MAKIITFSRKYPDYHPRKGEQTYFVEKFLNHMGADYKSDSYLQKLLVLNTKNLFLGKLTFEDIESFFIGLQQTDQFKIHTVRENERFKPQEWFSPRCWFGRPYYDPQIIFWYDTKIHSTPSFESTGNNHLYINDKSIDRLKVHFVAGNDGLSYPDFLNWFKYPQKFKGQIICWDKSINY